MSKINMNSIFHARKLLFCAKINYGLRWYRPRKPLWMGRAKTKMFRVPPRPVIPEDDKLELMKLYSNFKTEYKSIREFCRNEYYLKSLSSGEGALKLQQEEKEELERLLKENEEENKKMRVLREAFLSKEAMTSEERLQERILKHLTEQEKSTEERMKEIEMIAERSKQHITPETLDDVIEKALATEVDFTFAISPDGEQITRESVKKETDELSARVT